MDYGKNDIATLHDFYGKQRDDIFEGRQFISLLLLACTAEYNGYKAYVARQRIKQNKTLNKEEINLEARLLQASANRCKKERYESN